MVDRSDIPSPRFPHLASVKAAIANGKVISSGYSVYVVEIGDGLIVKHGERVYKSEAIALQFVGATTDVPVPRLHAYFSEVSRSGTQRDGYLVMEKLAGVPLVEALARLDDATCDKIASQLHQFVSALRRIPSQGRWGNIGREGVFHGGHFNYLHQPYTDAQLRYGNPCIASSARDVFEFFAVACNDIEGNRWLKLEQLEPRIDFSRPSAFSHGDLLPENIMVDESSGVITGIIDWERAGWYPYFWDTAIVRSRQAVYERNPAVGRQWARISAVAFEDDPSEVDAGRAFSALLYWAMVNGQNEYSHLPCVTSPVSYAFSDTRVDVMPRRCLCCF
ncbi:kinase-like protein [Trametes polyzona]|nr:kinase-like protein [Trametes polyzona]